MALDGRRIRFVAAVIVGATTLTACVSATGTPTDLLPRPVDAPCSVGAGELPQRVNARPIVPVGITAIHVCVYWSDFGPTSVQSGTLGDWWVGPFAIQTYVNAINAIRLNSPHIPTGPGFRGTIKASQRAVGASLMLFTNQESRLLTVAMSGGISWGRGWRRYARFSENMYGYVPARLQEILADQLK